MHGKIDFSEKIFRGGFAGGKFNYLTRPYINKGSLHTTKEEEKQIIAKNNIFLQVFIKLESRTV